MVSNQKLDPSKCISLVINYFKDNFPNYKLGKKGSYTGYWWVEYVKDKESTIYFDGDIGGGFTITFSEESPAEAGTLAVVRATKEEIKNWLSAKAADKLVAPALAQVLGMRRRMWETWAK